MTTDSPLNLHEIPELRKITVQPDVELRPLTNEDAQEILAILERDPSIRERVSVAAKFHTAVDVADEVDALAKDPGAIRYTILVKNVPAGIISFWKDPGYFGQTPEPDGYGFGYFLDPQYRGTGIVSHALQKIMQITPELFTVKAFVAFTEDDNAASWAVLKKLGFQATDEVYGEPYNGWLERKHRLIVRSDHE